MMRVHGHRDTVVAERLWRVAILTAAGAIGVASQAEGAIFYWQNSDPGFSQPAPTIPLRRPRPRLHPAKKAVLGGNEASKPQGPLIISISIIQQKLRIYDANGFFAETPVSTGMKGHSTPMGVFSIIQTHKFHHSNIYSGAPMPYMQRITWSGVAMHAGVLPGYPASHGCIRMPMSFAVKMWNWTKMGARVVVTPGEITPASFSHPLLAEKRVVPKPIATNEPQADAPPATKADKAADADAAPKSVISEASLELRSAIGHDNGAKPVIAEQAAATPLRVQTRTAYAGALPATKAPVTMSDATPNSQTEPAAIEGGMASSDDKAAATKSSEMAAAEIASAQPAAADKNDNKQGEVTTAAQGGGDAAEAEAPASQMKAEEEADATKIEAKPDEARPNDAKAEAPKADAPKSGAKPEQPVNAVTNTSPSASDLKPDGARAPDKKAATAKPDPAASATAAKRAGQIAVLISRKDSRLYVRQNFSAVFDAPSTIAPSDRLLGTHVFTAQVDKEDASILHWSVVSLPVPARYADRRDEDEHGARRRKIAGAVEVKPVPVPDGPAEALDRLTIPADAMARITEALSTGGSIIVSDQGITAGQTGEGTAFIVSLR